MTCSIRRRPITALRQTALAGVHRRSGDFVLRIAVMPWALRALAARRV